MRAGTMLERMALGLCFGLWLLLLSGWALGGEVWEPTNDGRFDQAYRLNQADVSGFKRVLLDPLSVWYAAQEGAPGRVAELQCRFAAVFGARLEAHGFQLVDDPGESVLRLHVELVDMRINQPTSAQLAWSERFAFNVAPGHMTLVAEIRDTSTGAVLLRIADQDDAAAGGDPWPLVDEIFAGWADGIAATLRAPAAGALLAGAEG